MTLSLTAILIETTGNVSFALPLIVTFICAKWTGDLFTEGIYDTQIAVSEVIFNSFIMCVYVLLYLISNYNHVYILTLFPVRQLTKKANSKQKKFLEFKLTTT